MANWGRISGERAGPREAGASGGAQKHTIRDASRRTKRSELVGGQNDAETTQVFSKGLSADSPTLKAGGCPRRTRTRNALD